MKTDQHQLDAFIEATPRPTPSRPASHRTRRALYASSGLFALLMFGSGLAATATESTASDRPLCPTTGSDGTRKMLACAESPDRNCDAPKLPAGFTIPESTVSPDKRFGVLVPDLEHYIDWDPKKPTYQNQLVETATGRTLALIKGETGLEHMNHGGIAPQWTKDSSGLLWIVEGKWFPRAAVYLNLKDGSVAWQTDLLALSQAEILRRTRAAEPKACAVAVQQNKGNGSAYPEGFTINVHLPEGNPTLPLRFSVDLTSNPKAADWYPAKAEVFAVMKGVLESDGRIKWSGFQAWSGAAAIEARGKLAE